jgi:hypothetical protein
MKEVISTNMRADGTIAIYLGDHLLVEVEDGKNTEEFISDVLYGMGYEWMLDGTIRPLEKPQTKQEIYDEMCRLLTEYEDGSDMVTENELYYMLVKIQNNWEAVITVQEG